MTNAIDPKVLSAAMEIDWTVDAKTGCSNSSAEFLALVGEVERLIHGEAYALLAGLADQTARLILAQLVHKHHMAPRDVDVLSARHEDGQLKGSFTWGGQLYEFTAERAVTPRGSEQRQG